MRSHHAGVIENTLRAELVRRFELTQRAIEVLREDKRRRNSGLDRLVAVSNEELWFQFIRQELKIDDQQDGPAITLSPETDRYPPMAASRYFVHEASEELYLSALIHDDEEMQVEAVAEGHALRGVITAVEDVDPGRRLEPIWTLEVRDEAPLRVRRAPLARRSDSKRSFGACVPKRSLGTRGNKLSPRDFLPSSLCLCLPLCVLSLCPL